MAMAGHCASLDATWYHLPAPFAAAWFSPAAAAFENDALASALAHASASPSCPSPSPTPSSSTTTTTTSSASELSSVPYDAPAPAQPATCRPGGSAARRCTGRVSKRKPRASRRPPTTYIAADPADFRRMVQEITGLGVPGAEAEHASAAAEVPRRPDPLAFVLPTLDTSAGFLPPPPQQRWEDKATAMAGAGADESSLLLMRELEAMVGAPSGFPTLESWGYDLI